ncbi:olfactory receptor 8K5-like [Marmota flaviventris]|uniref:olfactory receptor 8K5-like n=1 Tax=Marmota flaviventris TaxID=93162 RepID=UPI003A86663D
MGQQNLTLLTEFILTGVSRLPELQLPLFGVFLLIYTTTVMGNLGMIILTKLDSRLHTPMYFFIRHLAFIDLGNSTVICPKMMVNFFVDQNIISFYACATQMACFILFIISELSILSVMAYDRYVAICNPLLYNIIMSQRLCHVLVGITFLYSTFQALLFPVKYFTLTFCGSKVISHFYCDVVPLLPMICSDAQETELLTILFSAFNLISSLLVVLVSYLLILLAIFRMHSAEGRKKAFSTCGSHLTVVVVFYGSLLFMYVQPKSSHSYETDKLASVFYTLVIPMLNPLIYSLRNKEVNNAFQRVLKNHCKVCF